MSGPCAQHSDRPATGVCALCQRPVCELCVRTSGAELRCPACAELGIAWERRRELGFFRAYLKTLRDVLLQPSKAFGGLSAHRGFKAAFAYDVLTQYLATSVPTFLMGTSVGTLPLPPIAGFTPAQLGQAILWSYPFSGLWIAGLDFLLALLMHATLKLTGPGIGALDKTYAAVVYGGTPVILNATVLPTALLIPQLWAAYATIHALREAHRISNARATAAVVVPYLLMALAFMGVVGVVLVRVYHQLMSQFTV